MASLFTFASLFLHLLCLNARCLRCHHQYCVALTFHVDKIFFPTGKELRGFWVLLGSIYDRTWDDIGGHRELQIARVFMWIRWNMRSHFRLQYESIEVQQFHKTVDPSPRWFGPCCCCCCFWSSAVKAANPQAWRTIIPPRNAKDFAFPNAKRLGAVVGISCPILWNNAMRL